MARRGHYGFERRRRADLQKAKQEAKRQRKTERAEAGTTGPEIGEAQDTGAPAGMWEWFSASRGRAVMTAAGTKPAPAPPDDWVLLTDVKPGEEPPEPR
ncbi:MAG: hypothetical protein A3H48_02555 [Candidatus Rokubacteria bacterium RIFCSPLOWO2_02_FULL_71_18]|nr:MAG: hypothetical protein A3H48_02555 [Candidatus Rokubacteria bacterium RIFCSPLOWO2_02_FULL_71_18]